MAMHNILRKTLAFVLISATLVALTGIFAQAEEVYTDTVRNVSVKDLQATSGKCGKNAKWKLQDNHLVISGKGKMDDFSEVEMAPWYSISSKITSVEIKNGITKIGALSFYKTSKIASLILPDSVEEIGDMAFAQCSNLHSVVFGENLKIIGRSAFESCEKLASIRLPEGIKTIKERAFYQCNSITGVVLPETAVNLGVSVFGYCNSLTYAEIKGKITVLPVWFFYGCSSLKNLYLPKTIKEVLEGAVDQCPSISYVDYGGSDEVYNEIVAGRENETLPPTDEKEFIQTEHADIGITKTDSPGLDDFGNPLPDKVEVSASITDKKGYEELTEELEKLPEKTKPDNVDIYITDTTVKGGVIADLEGKTDSVTVHTGQNTVWKIIFNDQDDRISGNQDFSVKIEKNEEPSKQQKEIIGKADSYIVTLGKTTLNTAVSLPISIEHALKTATIYRVNGKKLTELGSTIIDNDGMATFSLSGTKKGKYLIAIDVPNRDEEIIIPEKLYNDYGVDATLTDAEGNRYILTGLRKSDLPFSLGQLMVGMLVGMVVIAGGIGVVMTIVNRKKLLKPINSEDEENQ